LEAAAAWSARAESVEDVALGTVAVARAEPTLESADQQIATKAKAARAAWK
jgi:hypothetical protein